MLPIVLVLLVAASALAAPQTGLQLRNGGGGINNSAIGRALQIIDEGDVNVYILTAREILRDVARNPTGQALGKTIASLGELATGRAGDACAAANLINAYVRCLETGNFAGFGNNLNNYIQSLTNNIDNIVKFVTNPESVRYATGSRGTCAAEGRKYQFEEAWDIILEKTTPNQVGLVGELYCSAKRLYCAFDARSNNYGALVTATSLPVTIEVFDQAAGALSNLVQSLISGGNPSQAAAGAKQALLSASSRVTQQYNRM